VEHRDVERQRIRAPAEAELRGIGLLGFEVRDGLLALEPVQLGRFRRAEAAREREVGRRVLADVPDEAEPRREIREVVRAVRRTRVEAAAGAGDAVFVRVAVDHAIVVVVARVLEPCACFERPARRKRPAPLAIAGDNFGIHVVVVLLACRADDIGRRRTVGRPVVLILKERAARELGVETRDQLAAREGAAGRREHDATAVLAVLLDRLAEQEMLEEIHARAAEEHAELVAGRSAVLRREAQARRVAIGLGIRVRARDRGVAVGVLADNESRRLLVEVRAGKRELELAAACRARPNRVQLLFLES
jgi:hypothetical protein